MDTSDVSRSSGLSPLQNAAAQFGSPTLGPGHPLSLSGPTSSCSVSPVAGINSSVLALTPPMTPYGGITPPGLQSHLKLTHPPPSVNNLRVPSVFPRFSPMAHSNPMFSPQPRFGSTSLVQPPILFPNQYVWAAQYQRNLCNLMNLNQ